MIRTSKAARTVILSAAASVLLLLPLPGTAQTTDTTSDPSDSGYQSSFLANLDRANTTEEENARARLEIMRESRGTDSSFASRVLDQGDLQRQLYGNLLPGGAGAAGVSGWTSL